MTPEQARRLRAAADEIHAVGKELRTHGDYHVATGRAVAEALIRAAVNIHSLVRLWYRPPTTFSPPAAE